MTTDPLATGVAEYLEKNPHFFERHPELLTRLYLPDPHEGRAISLTERQVLAMREKIRHLEGRLSELFSYGEENDVIGERMHRLTVALIGAPDFEAIVAALNWHLTEDFLIPHVAVCMFAEEPSDEDIALKTLAGNLKAPYCGPLDRLENATLPFGAFAGQVSSGALVPLRDRKGAAIVGLIALGSEDEGRFYESMGTLYLERLGELVFAALERAG
ncbi:MAG: DUF484 family protein [Zoogloeaceae bacterium]|jgi:uncharacterized protein YigA (DUF484 family)|nr:DUF484 family protein [Zoogloeaceae bacterium]